MINNIKKKTEDQSKIEISWSTVEDNKLEEPTEEMKQKSTKSEILNGDNYEYYTYLGNNTYLPLNKVKLLEKLKSGLYKIVHIETKGWAFKKENFCTDELYNLPIKELSMIFEDISKFWKTKEKFDEYGLIHKRGILLYGKPGCGKSCAIQMMIKDLINKQDGLIFKIGNSDDLNIFVDVFGSVLRIIEPNRRVICIIEDIDGLFEESRSTQTRLLNLLDGINQSSNIVYLATTNYPEKLEERILNRPSRFDKRYEFGLPEKEIRKIYLKNLLKDKDLKNIDINLWVDKSEGLTLSHLRELVVSVIILENNFEEEIKTLKNMSKIISSSSYKDSNPAGFKISKNT